MKPLSHLLLSLVVGAAALPTTACLESPDELELAELSSELSVSNWSAPQYTGQSYRSAQVATLGGIDYKVESGRCGAWSCGGGGEANELWWSKKNADGTWTAKQRIPGQYSGHKTSLAPFNGYLYMVHTGYDSGATNVWLTRFSPATQSWSSNIQLAYKSKGGPPAIAAYNNLLYLAGVDPDTDRVWYATMTPGEVFTASRTVGTNLSTSRVSLAVHGTKISPARLYLTHRHGISTNVVISSFDGTSWSPWGYVPAGPQGVAAQSNEPVIASYAGYLHLVFRRPDSSYVWWTYNDGTGWPAAITVNNLTSSYDPSLAATASGLTLVTTTNDDWNWVTESRNVYLSRFVVPIIVFPPPVLDPGMVAP